MEAKREAELLPTVRLKPGGAALLAWLKARGVTVVLATSSKRDRAVDILTRLGVVQYFDDMVFGTEIERGKPYPDIFPESRRESARRPGGLPCAGGQRGRNSGRPRGGH